MRQSVRLLLVLTVLVSACSFGTFARPAAAQTALPLTINGTPASQVLDFGVRITVLTDADALIFAYSSVDCTGISPLPASRGRLDVYPPAGSRYELSFRAEKDGAASACLWVRWRDSLAVPHLTLNGQAASITVKVGDMVTAFSDGGDAPGIVKPEVRYFPNATCSGPAEYVGSSTLRIVSYQNGFTGSFQATYTNVTEDVVDVIDDYNSACLTATWRNGLTEPEPEPEPVSDRTITLVADPRFPVEGNLTGFMTAATMDWHLEEPPVNGTVELAADGHFIYTATNTGAAGDRFTAAVITEGGETAVVTVQIVFRVDGTVPTYGTVRPGDTDGGSTSGGPVDARSGGEGAEPELTPSPEDEEEADEETPGSDTCGRCN